MIFDEIKNLSLYADLVPGMAVVADCLKRLNGAVPTEVRTELGGGVYVNVNRYATKADGRFESHKSYIDLQYVISGKERMDYAALPDCYGDGVYDEAKDIAFYDGAEHATTLIVSAGNFTLFFPTDAHRPSLQAEGEEQVVKLVFKIPVPEYENMAYLKQLLPMISMPADTTAAVLAVCPKLSAGLFAPIHDGMFAQGRIDEAVAAAADTLGEKKEVVALTSYLLLGKTTFYRYLSRGIDPKVYFESMTDFTIWEDACRRRLGYGGLEQTGWLACTLRMDLFRLGRFQYQMQNYPGPEYQIGNTVIRRGDPILQIHIPEGAPITDDVRHDSYRRAYAFFRSRPEYAHFFRDDGTLVYFCESWLFYPAHRDFLQKGSNIVRFMDDFTMLTSQEQYGDYGCMWRIYGFGYDFSKPETLPGKTGMQRAYAKHLLETGKTGEGSGVFTFDGETFKR